MGENRDTEDEVTLMIENTAIKCKKQDLMRHSDYFKVMFEGCFVERDKKTVKLEDIDLKAMNIILSLLWDRTFLINEEDILSVLQVSCMLQFVEIRAVCIDKLKEILLPRNCVKIWLITEQLDVKPLYLKAKSMALIEFNNIKDMDCLMELQLKQLCNYLGNTNLQCQNEMDVFQTCMKWWYENSDKYSNQRDCSHLNTYLKLLSCLNFNNVSNSDIQEIMMYPDFASNDKIKLILQCIIDLRHKIEVNYDENIVSYAKKLMTSKNRSFKQCPCILVNALCDAGSCECKRKRNPSSESNSPVIYYDIFKRKRYYADIRATESSIAVLYYNSIKQDLIKLLDINKQKIGNLDGFKLTGYKEFIFLYGGEFLIGKGNWNKNIWVYNTIRESWERKSVMPFVRRHFESCFCGNYLYIIGGTGNFRVIQDNMFSYNFKDDKWSTQIVLPCEGRQIKCCCWKNQLLIININNKSGYMFDDKKFNWSPMVIFDEKHLVTNYPDNYAVFAYKNSIYIKGSSIIELQISDNMLAVVGCKQLQATNYHQIESVLCGDELYSLYMHVNPEQEGASLSYEKYNLVTQHQEFIFKDIEENRIMELEGDQYLFRMSTLLFSFQHYELLAVDDFVNNLL